MGRKSINVVIYLAAICLLVTGVAKLLSSMGRTGGVLEANDPVFGITFRWLFRVAGVIELIIGLTCFFSNRLALRAGLIAWLATIFAIYRIGLTLVNWHKPCSCLGTLTDVLHIPPQTADLAMKIILGYLLVGGYATLLWLWKQKGSGTTPLSGSPSMVS